MDFLSQQLVLQSSSKLTKITSYVNISESRMGLSAKIAFSFINSFKKSALWWVCVCVTLLLVKNHSGFKYKTTYQTFYIIKAKKDKENTQKCYA